MSTSVAENIGIDSNIRVRVIRAHTLREAFGCYDGGIPLTESDRSLWTRRALSEEVEPEVVHEVHNVTVRGLHAYLAENLRRGSSTNRALTHLSLGTGDSANATVDDTALGNETGRVSVSASEVQNGTELYTATYIGTNEFNDQTLTELGLRLSNGVLANRAPIPPTPKTNVIGLTVEAIISFTNV